MIAFSSLLWCHRSYQRCTATTAVFRKHQVELYQRRNWQNQFLLQSDCIYYTNLLFRSNIIVYHCLIFEKNSRKRKKMLHLQEALLHLVTLSDYSNCIAVYPNISICNVVSSAFCILISIYSYLWFWFMPLLIKKKREKKIDGLLTLYSWSSLIFSIMRSWKCGWNRYTEPSTPIVTLFSPILFSNVAIPALTRWAALLDNTEHTYLTFSQSWSVTLRTPNSANTSLQFVYFPLGSLEFTKIFHPLNHLLNLNLTLLLIWIFRLILESYHAQRLVLINVIGLNCD